MAKPAELKWHRKLSCTRLEYETAKEVTACSQAHCDSSKDTWQSYKLWIQEHSDFYICSATCWLFDFGPYQNISIYICKMGIS